MNADNNRRIENIIRFGTIAEVDYSTATARVKSGEIHTDFLPFLTFRSGKTRTWSPPTIGEQCVILAMSGELTTACIITGLYTQNAPSNSPDEHLITFTDGAQIKYNQKVGSLTINGIKTASITASRIDIDCPIVNIKGNVNIAGALTMADNADTKGNMIISGNINLKGNVKADGDIIADTISLKNHTHREQGDGKDTSKSQ